MPTRLQIRNWVRAETLVESTMMSDADINAIIDQAVRDVSTRFNWPFLAKTDTIAFVLNQQEYTLPTDFDRLVAVMVDGTTTKLTEVGPAEYWAAYGDSPPSGTPAYFFLWANQIFVSPVPTASTGGLVLRYFRAPTLMTDDAHVPEFASQFHMILAEYASLHLWHREEDFSKARVYEERYLDGVERMARYYLGRAIDAPLVMGGGMPRRSAPSDAWRFPFFP